MKQKQVENINKTTNLKEPFLAGCIIGGLAWLVLSFVLVFKTIYSNFFIENMNPQVKVPFYSFDYWLILILALIILLLFFGIISVIYNKISMKLGLKYLSKN